MLLTKEPNSAVLDKIWDASTNVKDLKEYVKSLSRDSDLNTNLFLMTNGLDTVNDEFKLMANVYELFKYNQEHNTVTITARQFGTEKFKLEKAIYRLSQLGIVSDWVIEDFLMARSMSSSSAYQKKVWKRNLSIPSESTILSSGSRMCLVVITSTTKISATS